MADISAHGFELFRTRTVCVQEAGLFLVLFFSQNVSKIFGKIKLYIVATAFNFYVPGSDSELCNLIKCSRRKFLSSETLYTHVNIRRDFYLFENNFCATKNGRDNYRSYNLPRESVRTFHTPRLNVGKFVARWKQKRIFISCWHNCNKYVTFLDTRFQ